MANNVLKKFSINTAPVKKADGSIRFIASDANPDRIGDRVFPEGIDLTNYNANPILLWDHQASQPNIGTGKVYVESGTLFLEPTFSTANPLAQQIKAQVDAGEIRAVSIGFIPLESKPNEKGGYDYTKVELTEVSLCNIPCHPGALRSKALPEGVGDALHSVLQKLTDLQAEVQALITADAAEEQAEGGEPAKADDGSEPTPPPADPAPETESQKFFALFLAT